MMIEKELLISILGCLMMGVFMYIGDRRRKKQAEYNQENNIIPKPIIKRKESALVNKLNPHKVNNLVEKTIMEAMSTKQLKTMITQTKKKMERMAKELNFIEAARLRDELFELENQLKK